MLKKAVLIFLSLCFTLNANPQNPKGNIKGKIVDLETQTPLIGVNILINGTATGTSTNETGEYLFENLTAGTYAITFSYLGYERLTKTDIIVKPDRTIFINIELKSSSLEIQNIIVESGYFSAIENKPISTVNFSAEEIRRAPGSAGDVSRILFGLPSLAKVNDQYNSLIVRGGSPVENSFYLDNIEIPNINHFPVQGSSDGPIGLLNVDFIEDVNFYSGGFTPIYGDKLSSIMEIEYREGNKDKFAPQINLSLAGFGGSVEGPVGSAGNYMLSINKSYLDLILNEDETGGAMPNYGDLQGKLVYNINDRNKISILNLMSVDQINLKYENAIETNVTNVYGKTDGITNTAGINWRYIWEGGGYSNTSIAHTFTKYNREYFETKSKNLLTNNRSVENSIKIRNVNYYKLNKQNSIEFGVEGSAFINKFDYVFESWQDNYGNITPRLEVNNDMNSYKFGIFGVEHLQLNENLKLTFGARADYFEISDNINFSPRLSFSYDINNTTTFSGSAGIFYQDIPNYILSQSNEFNKLKTSKSNHYILGISRKFGESTRFSIEAYYKNYKNFPIDPAQPNLFLFDQVTQLGLFLNHDKLIDNGKGISKGIEILLQKKLASDFYGMAAASISKARYTDLNGNWYDRIYDNRFNFTLEGGYVPNDEWEFSLRWIYAGGAPYTPFDYEASAENNKGIYDLTKTNSERLPDYHSLNLRADKRFYFEGSNLIIYLSVWNVYGRENIAQYVWNEIENKPDEQLQWSTLPVLGIEFEF